MKKIFATLALLLITGLCANAQDMQVKQSDYTRIQLTITTPTPHVSEVNLMNGQYARIAMEGYGEQNVAGMPALPALVKIVEIPLGEGLNYTIDNIVVDTIDAAIIGVGRAIVPTQPSRRKNDTTAISLVKNEAAYNTDAFCGNSVIELEALGVARNSNLARLTFNPMRWNPVTNQIIIVKSLTVSIRQTNVDIAATHRMKQLHSSGAFDNGMHAINSIGPKDAFRTSPLRYTIVANSMFRGELDEFATWKKRQGFIVDLAYTDDANVGSTVNSIKAYLKSLYDNATAALPAPTYVLFVGDVAQIPATVHSYSGDNHYSDLDYCCWTAGDYLPDCYYGRFSAQNSEQLQAQISKTLMYEQYTFPSDSYLSTAALIAGVDGGYSSDNAYKYADPTMDYIAKTYITAGNGFNNIIYYKNNTSFAPTGVTVTGSSNSNSTAAALKNLYNNGCGWVNYSAHGGTTSWSSPSFTNSDVAAMTNNNKPMFMIGNCCLTNSFQVDACFGEALLRKGNNAGAIIYIGGSNSTYWTEDFYWSVGVRNNISNTCNPNYDAQNLGMYDHLFHSHGEPFAQHHITAGAMMYAGNASVESSTSSLKEYYWQIYHIMGDPSLMPYIHGTAYDIPATLANAVPMGCNTMTIQTVPFAYIGFTNPQHELVAATFADDNGVATLNFQPLNTVGEYEVVITAQGYKPFSQTIDVIANGPYVSVSDLQPSAQMIANGDISFNVTLHNLGVETADTITIEFISTDNHILFDTIGQINIPVSLQPDETISINNVCSGHIWGNTPDQTRATIKTIVRWGSQSISTSTNYFNYTINADCMQISSHQLDNHFEDLGTATLSINNVNNGHATLNHASVNLISLDPLISIANSTTSIDNINPGQVVTSSFPLTLNGGLPEHRRIPLLQSINNGFTNNRDTIYIIFGVDNSAITFEDSSMGNVEWTQGEYTWEITSSEAYEGHYSLRSHKWNGSSHGSAGGHGCTSDISIAWNSTYDDTISFYLKVSSEQNYDVFHFYIDSDIMHTASGVDGGWEKISFAVPQGNHTFRFEYVKDYSVSRGTDAAYIDYLKLPCTGYHGYRYLLDTVCQGEQYVFNNDTIETSNFEPGNYIFFDSIGSETFYLTLVVRLTPEITIADVPTTIQLGESVRLDATTEGVERYLWNTGETSPIIVVYPTRTTTYTVTGYNGRCNGTASVTINVEGVLGIEQAREKEVNVYPNPATNMITVEGDGIIAIKICDITSRIWYANSLACDKLSIDISDLTNGAYFLITEFKDGAKQTSKLIKK